VRQLWFYLIQSCAAGELSSLHWLLQSRLHRQSQSSIFIVDSRNESVLTRLLINQYEWPGSFSAQYARLFFWLEVYEWVVSRQKDPGEFLSLCSHLALLYFYSPVVRVRFLRCLESFGLCLFPSILVIVIICDQWTWEIERQPSVQFICEVGSVWLTFVSHTTNPLAATWAVFPVRGYNPTLGRLVGFCAGAGHFEGWIEGGTPRIKQAKQSRVTENRTGHGITDWL
jgi:hypothetical protein